MVRLAVREDAEEQRGASGAGEDAVGWFARWGASVEASSGFTFHGDVLASRGFRLSRVWHTPATVRASASGQSVVILPLQGILVLAAEGRGELGELSRGSFAVIGDALGYTVRTASASSWIEIRTSAVIGDGVLGSADAVLLRDPAQLPAMAVQFVNAILSSGLQPDTVAFEHLRQGIQSLLTGAILSAHASA